MRTDYNPGLKATVRFDDAGRVRGIVHLDEYREMMENGRDAAAAYIRDIAETLDIRSEALRYLDQPLSYVDPRQQGVEYRFSEEKVSFDSATYVYYQTFLNTPVWAAGITATLKQAPARIVAATNTSVKDKDIDAKLPSPEAIDRYRRLFATAERIDGFPSRRRAGRPQEPDIASSDLLSDILGDAARAARGLDDSPPTPRLIRGRFYICRYHADERTLDESPTLPLRAVHRSIQNRKWHLVAELMFSLPHEGAPMNWRTFVEVETDSIVHLRALSSGVTGKVFIYDPVTRTGNKDNTSNKRNAVLDDHRQDDQLRNLNPPVGPQALEGTWAKVVNITPPKFDPPTRPAGSDFDAWSVRTNEFAAVNAYYHVDRFFRLVADLGFQVSGPNGYFGDTEFPVEVDHRGFRPPAADGNVMNAGVIGRSNGIGHLYYALADVAGGVVSSVTVTNGGSGYTSPPDVSFTSWGIGSGAKATVQPGDIVGGVVNKVTIQDGGKEYVYPPLVQFSGGGGTGAFATAEIDIKDPIGIATDWRITLHELGGHGTLWPHVGEGQFKFAHSAGDSFAMILNDYESKSHDGDVPDRYLLLPFEPLVTPRRRSDRWATERSVAAVNVPPGRGGSGYLSVSLTGGGGSGAKAGVLRWHIIAGTVTRVTVIDPGSGYTSAPKVEITGGGGSGAEATAEIGPSGSLSKVTVTNGGSGYACDVWVELSGGGAPTTRATAAVKVEDIVDGAVNKVTVTQKGAGYTSAPSVKITGSGSGAEATAQIEAGVVKGVTVTNHGSGYVPALQVQLSGGDTPTTTKASAAVKPEHIIDNVVKSVTVGDPGLGYTSAPSVNIIGGGGSGAEATAELGAWGWGDGMDTGTDGGLNSGYFSEQILSTTMFRAYQSIGGDSKSVNRRKFAAHCMTYLMLRAIQTLSPVSNPQSPDDFLGALQTADATNWISEGVCGGAYGKVLTWAFEKQHLNDGSPPPVDVYIDDGRAGEYQYVDDGRAGLPVHWETTTIWNRRNPDGLSGHQEPALGRTNFAYVKIKNRGTTVANDVIVKGYHCKPSAGILWPNDLQPFTTSQLSAGTLQPNDAEEKIVGPFEWTPVANAWGHDCMLMIVSATGDPSNINKFTAGEVIEDWRLVPNDNNVAQRNVILVPGGGGPQGLIAGLHGKGFWASNPGRRAATITASVAPLPPLLAERGWRIGHDLPADGVRLKPREQRLVTFDLHAGGSFTKADVEAATKRDIVVTVTANDAPIGGMTYRIDPDLDMPFNERTSASAGSLTMAAK